jgi:hypothetical protein
MEAFMSRDCKLCDLGMVQADRECICGVGTDALGGDPDVRAVSLPKEKPRRSGVRQFRGSAFVIGLVALPVLWSRPDAPAHQWLELELEWRSAD